ncbi:hypothetical protein BHE90_001838 [Fusarium euwallaceae]|uniref:DUF7908 domain-containing protein n=1 Tax=Fusarium euwallaceae TaxID=1147111 RepID=A0A430M6K0_9HYPO|nr:hypothetical protein BHE90_001838 [Fusarium euwallaceae]
MRPGLVLAALGGIINVAVAAGLVKDGDPMPASWCITYLSTYLAPVPTKPAGQASSDTATDRVVPSLLPPISRNPPSVVLPGASSTEEQQLPDSSITSVPLSSVTSGPLPSVSSGTLLPTDVVSSDPVATATAGPNPGGRSIIFQVVPSTDPEKRDLSKRALGGYVASGGTVNPDVCTDADTFTLTSGQLLDNDIPIYYDGEEFKLFGGQRPPPDDAITTTFENVGGSLRWVNPSLPNGQAGFCQVAASGQVYITFSSRPEGCRPVTISVFTVEQCLNGELDARVPSDSTSAATANPTGIPSSGVGISQVTVSTNTVDSTESPESSELPATLPGESTSSKASPASTSSKVSSVLTGSGTAVPDDVSSSIVRTQSTDGPPSVETSTDGNPPTSSGDDASLTNAPSTTSPLSEPTSSATDSSDTDLSTSDLPATDSSSTFTESPSSAELSSSLASTDFSLDPTTDLSFSATSYEASSTGSLPITDGTTSSAPMTTEPSTTESLDSSSSETTVSTEPASSSSDSDTTTSPDTTTSEPTTTTSAEVEPTVLFASDDLNGHQGEYRQISTSFRIYMYDAFSQILTVSVNGIIVLGSQVIDSSPHTSLPAQSLLYAVLPYWTENTILPFTQQGITYRTLGTAPERTLVIEFKVTPAIRGEPVIPDHYTVTFFENRQRYCVVRYFRTEGKGSDATIGNQLQSPIPFNEFSYNEPSAIDDNKELSMTLEESGVFTYN